MIPKRLFSLPEKKTDIDISDVEKALNADYKEVGSIDKAMEKLKEILKKSGA